MGESVFPSSVFNLRVWKCNPDFINFIFIKKAIYQFNLGILQGYGHEIITAHHDIYGALEYEPGTPLLRDVRTYYEELFSAKGKTITYIKFRLK